MPHTPDAPTSPAPYAQLTPHVVLHALDAVNLRGDGRLLQLNSYENRVFQVWLEDGDSVVAKFYRPARWSDAQILEEHAFALELAQAEVPVVAPLTLSGASDAEQLELLGTPPTLARLPDALGLRYAVTPRRAGRSPELDDDEVLAWIGRFIGRIHALGSAGRFEHRARLDVDTLGRRSARWLIEHDAVAPDVAHRWREAVSTALDLCEARFAAIDGLRWRRVHGDCHPGNLLWTEAGPHFVDLDDCGTGVAVHDLWMLLPGDADGERRCLASLLEGYEQFCEFDRRELTLIEPLRTLRQIYHGAWLAQRWSDSAFPAAFPWFGTSAYWSEQTQQLLEQIERMSGGA